MPLNTGQEQTVIEKQHECNTLGLFIILFHPNTTMIPNDN